MTKDQFNKEVCNMMGKCYALLNVKAAEYAADEDRLSAFKEAALLSKETAESIAANYMLKHIMSIKDMSKRSWKYDPEKWDEKICDAINYLLIIHTLVTERQNFSRPIKDSFYYSAVGKIMGERFENED